MSCDNADKKSRKGAITHPRPLWKDRANWLIMVDLSKHDWRGWEQLWARQVGEDEFILCCVPLFAYGMSLGDKVRAASADGWRWVISEVVEKSRRCLSRFRMKDATSEGIDRVGDGRRWVISEVVEKSGRCLPRFWMKDATSEGIDRVGDWMQRNGLMHECRGDLVAVDIPAGMGGAISELMVILEDIDGLGIQMEWGDRPPQI